MEFALLANLLGTIPRSEQEQIMAAIQPSNPLAHGPVEPLEQRPDVIGAGEDQVTGAEGGGRDKIVGERFPGEKQNPDARREAMHRNIARGVPKQAGR
jgi:hypothetical protein